MHTILVVEDEPPIADVLAEMCSALGCTAVRATTLAEVRARIDEGGFCAVLLDLQIPPDEHSRAMAGAGESALALLRRYDRRRTTESHVLPILAVTGYSTQWDFVSRLYKSGIDDFVPKSFDDGSGRSFAERMGSVLDTIRGALSKAGRVDHASCEALARGRTATATGAMRVSIRLLGEPVVRCLLVTVNGERRELQPALFTLLARLAIAHKSSPGVYVSLGDLGVAKSAQTVHRLRAALVAGLPEATSIIETKYGEGARLAETVDVELDEAALARHPNEVIRRLFRHAVRRPAK